MRLELKLILLEFLKQKEIVTSWGFSKPKINKKSFSFTVSAFRYKGKVRLICMKNGYVIEFGDIKIADQKLESVISSIDEKIEMSGNYTNEVISWIKEQTWEKT